MSLQLGHLFAEQLQILKREREKERERESQKLTKLFYVKVSMDGAPYLRKIDLKTFNCYRELSSALGKMFSGFTIDHCGSHGISSRDGWLNESRLMDLLHGSEYVLTYEDKDGDWMLVGDVHWEMFIDACTRMRIMKSSRGIQASAEEVRGVLRTVKSSKLSLRMDRCALESY